MKTIYVDTHYFSCKNIWFNMVQQVFMAWSNWNWSKITWTSARPMVQVIWSKEFSDPKGTAYKGLVRPILEYANHVWDPHGIVVQKELEKVQHRASRFVTGNYNFETGSMASILEQLRWESLHKRRKRSELILLFKGLKGRASIPCDDLQLLNRRSRNQHPVAFQVRYARTDIYKYSFFPDTIMDWNALPAGIISSAESSEDPVARFTSLVRSRD